MRPPLTCSCSWKAGTIEGACIRPWAISHQSRRSQRSRRLLQPRNTVRESGGRPVRLAPSNVSSDPKLCTSSQPSRPWRKSAPFRVGYPLVTEALSVPLQGGLRLFRLSSTPSAIPSLAVGIPPPRSDGASGAYPVVQWGKADGEAAPYSPAGHGATVVEGSIRRSDPHAILAPAYQHLWPVLDDGP